MGKKLLAGLLASLSLFTAASAVTGAVAWFYRETGIPDYNISGNTDGAYFAYGTGTVDDPFGIRTPKHLSNLAWLQYSGFFNTNNVDDEYGLDTYYFELDKNINCNGWTIPPIGTVDNPFVGNFNGNGYTISNLTVSNQETIRTKPRTIEYDDQPEIVGLFGVVGSITVDKTTTPSATYNTSTNQIVNTGIEGLTVISETDNTLVGVVAGYVNAKLQNVAVNNTNITVSATNAGVLSTIRGVDALSNYSLVGFCNTDYEDTITKRDTSIYSLNTSKDEFVAKEQGFDGGEYGGSVNMEMMYNRILAVRKRLDGTLTANGITNSTSTFYYRRVYNIAPGKTIADKTEDTGSRRSITGQANQKYRNSVVTWAGDKAGTFSLYNRYDENTSGWSTTYEFVPDYNYLHGGHMENQNFYRYTKNINAKIKYGSYYLGINNSGSLIATTKANAQTWVFSDNSTSTVSTTANNKTYYLRYNNSTLSAYTGTQTGTNYRTNWTIERDGDNISFSSNGYYLYINGNSWSMSNTYSPNPYYTIRSGSNYMGIGNYGYNISRVTSESSAAKWQYGFVTTDSGTFKGYYLSSKAMLCYYSSDYPLIAYNSLSGTYLLDNGTDRGEGKLVCSNNGSTTYYVRYSSNSWSGTNRANNATTVTVDYHVPDRTSIEDAVETENKNQSTVDFTKDVMVYPKEETTCIPLNTIGEKEDADINYETASVDKFYPTDKNTGYIVGGSNIPSDATSFKMGYSSIRVSSYSLSSYISNSFSSGTMKNVYTITYNPDTQVYNQELLTNSSGVDTALAANYTRYNTEDASTKNTVVDMLTDDNGNDKTNVYGLHFTDATLNKNNITTANVRINSENYVDNYQLPANSIDFNLKEKGCVNFFSGAYYAGSTVNSFFSLHQIDRTGTTINDIKEIVEIYQDATDDTDTHSYVYKYSDGKYSAGYITDEDGNKTPINQGVNVDSMDEEDLPNNNYECVFNTLQIKNVDNGETKLSINQNYLYYFEIPMNDGEFCLGSVSGGDGGYLIYLDIAANTSKLNRTTFVEKIISTEKIYPYPLGVALVNDVKATILPLQALRDTPAQDTTIVVDPKDSVAVKLYSPGQSATLGTVTLARTAAEGVDEKDNVALQITATEKAKSVYIGSDVDLFVNDSNTPAVASSKIIETTILRLQYWDYNTTTKSTLKTIIEDKYIKTTEFNGTITNSTPTRTVAQYRLEKDQKVWSTVAEKDWKIYNTTTGIEMTISKVKNINDTTLNNSVQISNNSDVVIITYSYDCDIKEITETLDFDVSLINNGTYYVTDNSANFIGPASYTITVSNSSGNITTFVVVVVINHNFTIKLNGTTIQKTPGTQHIPAQNP